MFHGTATRWITAPLLTMAVVAQSLAAVPPVSCQCSTSGSSVQAQTCCCCSRQAREQKFCCCSKTQNRHSQQSCCPAKAAGRVCHCGCSHRESEPATPAPSGQSEVNWESLLAECDQAMIEVTVKPKLGSQTRGDSLALLASAPSVQVLCCIWLT